MSTVGDTQEEGADDEYGEPFQQDQLEKPFDQDQEGEGTDTQNLDPFSQPFIAHDELVADTEQRWGFIGGGGGGRVLAWRAIGKSFSVIAGYEYDGATIARVERAGKRSLQGPHLKEQYRRQSHEGRLSVADIAKYGLVAWRVDSKHQENPTGVLIPMEKAWYPETYIQVYWKDHPWTWESRGNLRGIHSTTNYETDVYIYRLAIQQDAIYINRRTGEIMQYPDENGFMQNTHWRNVNAYQGAYWLHPRARKERRITNISEEPVVDSVHPTDEDYEYGQDPYDGEFRQESNEIGEQGGEEADAQDSYNGVSDYEEENTGERSGPEEVKGKVHMHERAPLTPPRSRGVTPMGPPSNSRRGAHQMSPISENSFYTPAAQNSGRDFLHRPQPGSQRLTPNRRVQSQGQSGNGNTQNGNHSLPQRGPSSQQNTPRSQPPPTQGAGSQRNTPALAGPYSQRGTPRNQLSAQAQGSRRITPAQREGSSQRGTLRSQTTPAQGARSQRNTPAQAGSSSQRGNPRNQTTPAQGAGSQRNTPAPAESSSRRGNPRNQATPAQGARSQRNTPAPAGSSSQRGNSHNQATPAQGAGSHRNTPAPARPSPQRGNPGNQPSLQAQVSQRNTPAPAESSSQGQSAHRPRQGGSTRISAPSPTQSPTENRTNVPGRRRQRRQPPRPGTRTSDRIRERR